MFRAESPRKSGSPTRNDRVLRNGTVFVNDQQPKSNPFLAAGSETKSLPKIEPDHSDTYESDDSPIKKQKQLQPHSSPRSKAEPEFDLDDTLVEHDSEALSLEYGGTCPCDENRNRNFNWWSGSRGISSSAPELYRERKCGSERPGWTSAAGGESRRDEDYFCELVTVY